MADFQMLRLIQQAPIVTLTIEAQCEAINAEPNGKWDAKGLGLPFAVWLSNGKWEAKTLSVPSHWLSAIINGDETGFDYNNDRRDYRAYKAFCAEELSDGWNVISCEEEGSFSHSHDASAYGVLACDTTECLAMRQKPTT